MKQRKRRIFAGVAAVAMLLWNFAALPQDTPLPQLELPVKAATVTEAVAPTAQATEIPKKNLVAENRFLKVGEVFDGEAYYKFMGQFNYNYDVERTTFGDWTFTTVEFKIKGSNSTQFTYNDEISVKLPYEVVTTTTDYWIEKWITTHDVADPDKHIVRFKVTEIADNAFSNYSIENMTIPASVKSIGKNAFQNCKNVQNVYIDRRVLTFDQKGILNPEGESVTTSTTSIQLANIGDNAFTNCKALEGFDLSDACYLTTVGNAAFKNCELLTSFEAGNSYLKSIGDEAFMNCRALTTATLPYLNWAFTLGSSAFENCSSLTSITLPGYVTELGENTFRECSALKSASLSDSITSIGDSCFEGCSSLETVDKIKGVVTIGDNAFKACAALTLKTLPPHLETIGYKAFRGTPSLEVSAIPVTVTSIGEEAFFGSGISSPYQEELVLPAGLTTLGDHAFTACANLNRIGLADGYAGTLCTKDGILYDQPEDSEFKTLICCPAGHTQNVYLDEKCDTIASRAFQGLQKDSLMIYLYSLDKSSLQHIEEYAFADVAVTSINSVFNGNIVTLDRGAFSSLNVDTLHLNFDTVASTMPAYCDVFENAHIGHLTIGTEISKIGDGLFSYIPADKNMSDKELALHQSHIKKLTYNTGEILELYPGTFSTVEEADITKIGHIEQIPRYMFAPMIGVSSLQKVTLPDTVTVIRWEAFRGCVSLTSFDMPPYVTFIDCDVFKDCQSLTALDLPDTLEIINPHAFMNSGIEHLYIPGNVNWIDTAFYDMPNLKWIALPNNADVNKGMLRSGIGFVRASDEVPNKWIPKKGNSTVIYGVEGTEVEKYAKHDVPFNQNANVTFAPVPDLGAMDPDFLDYEFTDPDKIIDQHYCLYNYTGEAIAPTLSMIFDGELSTAQQKSLRYSYSDNVNPGEVSVAISTRNPDAGVGIGHASFQIVDADCAENGNHAWGPWGVLGSNCTHEVRLCLNCGAREEQDIEEAHHEWDMENGEVTLAPTCTETGTMHVKCIHCETETDLEIPATGHTWATEVDEDGVMQYLYKTVDPTFSKEG